MAGKTLIIGDIHGCFAELQALLDAAHIGRGDRIIAMGDLAGRGPESPQVLEFFLARPDAVSIMGNHEMKHIRGNLGDSQLIARWQCGEDLYAQALAWMRGLPLYLDLPDALLVHWGLEPAVPLPEQRPQVLLGTAAGEKRLARILGDVPWYDAYQGPKPVVYGHHSYAAGVRRNLTYGIDTGCVYGQELTGLLLPDFELVSVPAREDHWTRLQADWAERLADHASTAHRSRGQGSQRNQE